MALENMTLEKQIRVLVVDDSSVIRTLIADSIAATPGMVVVGTAADGQQALDQLDSARPDVITLDIQMPRMDGLATVDAVLSRRPVPIIMVSSLTRLGAEITLDALDRGAVDYLAKPDYGAQTRSVIQEELPRKIRMAAGCDVKRIVEIRRQMKQRIAQRAKDIAAGHQAGSAGPKNSDPASHKENSAAQCVTPVSPASSEDCQKCIALGISTGGPPALSQLFAGLKPPLPPIVVVQHMPPNFTKPLAWRLDSVSKLTIREAEPGDILQPNHVLIAPGGKHLEVRRVGETVKAMIFDGPVVSGHKPSVDVMMTSVVKAYGGSCLGIIMTGMGRDGVDGCKAIRAAGGMVLGQDEESSDVYGMNKAAFVEGHVDRQFALDDASTVIAYHARRIRVAAAVV